jgi:transposase-like protein
VNKWLNWFERAKPGELAKEFGCHATSILNWVRQADGANDLVATPGGCAEFQ